MRILFVIIIVASLIGLSFVSKNKPAEKKNEVIPIVGSYAPVTILELFTSEGCSSCPPADNLLPELAKLDSNIIPLSFHVDYWNRLGWTDPFSSSDFSDRQREYAKQFNLESVYTPQLVINGEYEVVGSGRSGAEAAIKKALKEKTEVELTITDVTINKGNVDFTVLTEGDVKKTSLLVALVQKKATMKVNAGENRGVTLSHINVVRFFTDQVADKRNEFQLPIPKDLAEGDCRLVVYTQRTNDLKITGAVVYDPK